MNTASRGPPPGGARPADSSAHSPQAPPLLHPRPVLPVVTGSPARRAGPTSCRQAACTVKKLAVRLALCCQRRPTWQARGPSQCHSCGPRRVAMPSKRHCPSYPSDAEFLGFALPRGFLGLNTRSWESHDDILSVARCSLVCEEGLSRRPSTLPSC